MTSYAVYIRITEGYVERLKNVVSHLPDIASSSSETSNPYVHEESLVGFPESTVLWAAPTGPSVGIAPLSPDSGVHNAATHRQE